MPILHFYRTAALLLLPIIILSLPAQAQDIDQFSFKSLPTISGSISATTTFYGAEGKENQRDPFYWMLSGNLNVNYNGIAIPVSITLSQQQSSFTQPFNQFGMSPTYKGFTAHIGHRSMNFSEITLGGNMFLGLGAEYKPKKSPWRYSAMYGRLVKPIPAGSLSSETFSQPAYARWGYGGMISHERGRNRVDLIFFKAKDDETSITFDDSLAIRPAENAVIGLNVKQSIGKKFKMDIKAAYSGYTEDTRLPESPSTEFNYKNNLGPILTTNASTHFDKAFIGSFSYTGGLYNIKLAYRRIDPEFKTMGAVFLTNDIEDLQVSVNWSMLKRKLNVSAAVGSQFNNLGNAQVSRMSRFITNFNAVYLVNNQLNITANYSNFNSETKYTAQLLLDSLNYIQVTQNAGLGINYTLHKGKIGHNFFIMGNYQDVEDPNNNSSSFYNMSGGYQRMITHKNMAINANLTFTNNTVTGLINNSFGPTLSVTKTFFDKQLKTLASATWLESRMEGDLQSRFMNFRVSGDYRLGTHHTFTSRLTFLNRSTFGDDPKDIQEYRAEFSYRYTF